MEARRKKAMATDHNRAHQQANKRQKGNNHGGKRKNSGRYTKGEKAAQFATSDQKQPTIKRAFGGMYSKQAKTPGAKRLTRQEALLKRAFEE